MYGLSEISTLLASVEEYYVTGKPIPAATFVPAPVAPDPRAHENPPQAPKVETSVRVHLIGTGAHRALLTVITHSNRPDGQRGTIHLDLKSLGIPSTGYVINDSINGGSRPLAADIEVDTTKSGNMALLEITPAKANPSH
jgi:hypothetical protein